MLTAVAVLGEFNCCVVNANVVTFLALRKDDLERYWSISAPLGKAEPYAIQGKAAVFMRSRGKFLWRNGASAL